MKARGKHMLIVEDTESIALLLSACFTEDGFSVKISSTLKEATRFYRASLSSNSPFDVLLVDNCLPDGSGIAFLRKIDTLGNSPVKIMLSADGSEKTKIEALSAGADQFLEKPVNTLDLRNTVAMHLNHRSITNLKTDTPYEREKTKLLKNYLLYLQNLAEKLHNPMTYEELKCHLHQLKGSAALYDLFDLSSAAGKLSRNLQKSGSKLTSRIRQNLITSISSQLKMLTEKAQ
ncbi:MAG: response regulator [Kordiimonadaceae bacterium]|nr:response regulator [Kordiimonadaceae bacterium]